MPHRHVRLMAQSTAPPAPAALTEPLLTPDDVAELLGIKRTTVYELARNGRMPFVKVGRALRFLRTDLEAWLDQQRDAR